MLLLLTHGRVGQAQEALLTAVQETRAFDARQGQIAEPQAAMTLGPVRLNAGLSYSMQWNDNLEYADTNPESGFILTPQLNLGALWQVTDKSHLNFSLGIGYQRYVSLPELSRLQITPDSELAWDIMVKDFVFSVYYRLSYSQDVASQGSLSGTATFPRLETTAGLTATWQPSRYVFRLGYARYNFYSQSSSFDFLSRASDQFSGSAAYRFAEQTELGLQASGSLTHYTSGIRPDYQSISLGPFLNWQLRESLSIKLHGGYVRYLTDPEPIPVPGGDVSSYYIGLEVNQQLTDYITHGLTAVRDVQPGVNRGDLFMQTLQINYFVTWAFRDHFTFGIDGYFEHGNTPRIGIAEEYDRYGAGFRLTWQPLDKLSTSVGYHYTEKVDTFSTFNYQQNAINFSVAYQF